MSDEKFVIYHNPSCSKSRETLQILEDNQCTLQIVEYLETPPDEKELRRLVELLDIGVRDLLRTSEQIYHDANLEDDTLSDDEIIAAICKYPALLQRPIVVLGNKAIIGRPPERVLEIIA